MKFSGVIVSAIATINTSLNHLIKNRMCDINFIFIILSNAYTINILLFVNLKCQIEFQPNSRRGVLL